MDISKLIASVLSQGNTKSFLTGAITGAIGGAMTGKTGKKVASSALKVGGMALIGGLAYKAFQQYQQNKTAGGATGMQGATQVASQMKTQVQEFLGNPTQALGGFLPAPDNTKEINTLGLILLRAMIAAAKADGTVDAQENEKIFGQIKQGNFSLEEKSFLLEELGKPLHIDSLVAVATTPEIAAEIYTASVLVMDDINPAEHAYLEVLAARLGLEPELALHLRASVEQVREAAV